MFLMSYNCRGLNDLKKHYVKTLLKDCDILFIQEHWLSTGSIKAMHSEFPDHNVFAKTGMTENTLLAGRPYGGTAIIIRKTLSCTSVLLQCDSKRICPVMSDFTEFKILFLSLYMPCDSANTIDDFNYKLSTVQALAAIHKPDYIICGGDMNTDLSRLNSLHTECLLHFCNIDNLVCVDTVSCSIEYTYTSDVTNSVSTIDHFIISKSLCDRINKYTTIDDLDNMSDHLPLCLSIDLPVCDIHFNDTRHFQSKPKWNSASSNMLLDYKAQLDILLNKAANPKKHY